MSFAEVAWLSNARKAVKKSSSSRRNMVAKYYWTRGKEAWLLNLYKQGIMDPKVLARELNREAGAAQKKLERLVVVVVPTAADDDNCILG